MKVAVGTIFPKAGDFCWAPDEMNPDRIVIGIPSVGRVSLRVVRGNDLGTPQVWGWDGNIDQPTLTPSIDSKGDGGAWHGHMVNGELK